MTPLQGIISNPDLEQFKNYISSPINNGYLKHHVKNFIIKHDDIERFKIAWNVGWLESYDKHGLMDYIYEVDAIECFKYIEQNRKWAININFHIWRCIPKILFYLFEKTKNIELFKEIVKKHRFNTLFEDFFIGAYKLIGPQDKNNLYGYDYDTVLFFSSTRNEKLVKWILDQISNYIPTRDQLLQIKNNLFCINMMRLFCNHSQLVWMQVDRTNKSFIDPDRLAKDEYNEILNFPFLFSDLPVYFILEMIQIQNPSNQWLIRPDTKIEILKLLENIRKRFNSSL